MSREADAAAASNSHLAGAVRATGLVTLLSRLGGLVREVLLVWVFGPTALGSAFAAAFAVPNTFRRLFGEGALSSAFIPEYTDALRAGRNEGGRLASLTIRRLALVTVLITVMAETGILVVLMTSPESAGTEHRSLMLKLVMVMFPFMPLICCAAVLSGMLQVHGRYGPAASGPIVLNLFMIGVGVYFVLTNQVGGTAVAYALGAATLLSGLTQCFWFARLLRGQVMWTRDASGVHERSRRMMRRFVPVAIGLGTLQVNSLLDTLIATWPLWASTTMFGRACPLDESSNIILTAVQRLYQFPLGVFGIAVASAAFPLLARHSTDGALFEATLRRAVRLSLFIGLPATAGLIVVGRDMVAVFYSFPGRETSFEPEDVARAAAVLTGYGVAIWAFSLNHVLTRAFYARGDTATPLRISVMMVGLNLALNLTLIWWIREAGLAWATSVSAVGQLVLLLVLARHRLGVRTIDADVVRSVVKLMVATAIMAAAAWASVRWIDAGTWAGQMMQLGIATAVGAATYGAAAIAIRAPELAWLARRG